jgi:hypothetical protein
MASSTTASRPTTRSSPVKLSQGLTAMNLLVAMLKRKGLGKKNLLLKISK